MEITAYQYYVLCEGKRDYHFIEGYLEARGVKRRKIRPARPFPEGRQSGSQFVTDAYKEVLPEIRNKHARARTALVVMRDADARACHELERDFPSQPDEAVFLALPRRNIETWFCYLDNQEDPASADEERDRKQRDYKCARPKTYGQKMAACDFPRQDCIPESLKRARDCARAKKERLP